MTTPTTFEEFWDNWQPEGFAAPDGKTIAKWPDAHTRFAAESAWNAAVKAYANDGAEHAYAVTLERAKAAEDRVRCLESALLGIASNARAAARVEVPR